MLSFKLTAENSIGEYFQERILCSEKPSEASIWVFLEEVFKTSTYGQMFNSYELYEVEGHINFDAFKKGRHIQIEHKAKRIKDD